MKSIPLTRGMFAIIDDVDFDRVSAYKWHAAKLNGRWYAARNGTRKIVPRRKILMHRFIMNAPDGVEVDHKNRDSLINTRKNLRLATKKEQMYNRGSWGKSGFKGVSMHRGKFTARINGKYLGLFSTAVEAAKAYDDVAKVKHGEFAVLNFGG